MVMSVGHCGEGAGVWKAGCPGTENHRALRATTLTVAMSGPGSRRPRGQRVILAEPAAFWSGSGGSECVFSRGRAATQRMGGNNGSGVSARAESDRFTLWAPVLRGAPGTS